ncbi:hypothetical protein C0995_004954, partial [Termitomyces sp. Mi166
KDAALNPDSVQIEGEWDLPSNPDSPQASTPSSPPTTSSKTKPSTPQNVTKLKSTNDASLPLKNTKIVDEKVEKHVENLSKLPQVIPDTSKDENSPPANAPHLRTHSNSLSGLPQFDPTQYGRGLRRNATKVNQTAGLAESAFIVDALDILELSGVEIEGTDAEWVHKTIKHALAASKD